MEIKKVAILGAGAVGSYVIEGISGCREIRLGVIAEGERNARLKSAGCTINGVTYHPEVWTSQETDNIDLLIVSLKYGALPTALDTIKQPEHDCYESDEWCRQRRNNRSKDWHVQYSPGFDQSGIPQRARRLSL